MKWRSSEIELQLLQENLDQKWIQAFSEERWYGDLKIHFHVIHNSLCVIIKKKLCLFGTGSLGNNFYCFHYLWQHLSGKSHDHLIIGNTGKPS
jgi:hypothetical protein